MIRTDNKILEITLYCVIEKTFTKHVLNNSGTHLVCGCGEQVEYHVSKEDSSNL